MADAVLTAAQNNPLVQLLLLAAFAAFHFSASCGMLKLIWSSRSANDHSLLAYAEDSIKVGTCLLLTWSSKVLNESSMTAEFQAGVDRKPSSRWRRATGAGWIKWKGLLGILCAWIRLFLCMPAGTPSARVPTSGSTQRSPNHSRILNS